VTFHRPWLLLLALLLPLAVAAGIVLAARRRRRAAEAFGEYALVRRLARRDLAAFPWRRAALLVPAAALLGVAAADPRWGRSAVEEGAGGAEVVLVLDASNSMLVEDVRPSRLERERAAARDLVRALPASRFGVVVFSARGYVLTPLTGDPGALELYLDALSPEIVTQGGSSLASAVRQGTDLLLGADSARAGRAMVLMSDGEALEEREDVRLAVRRAARAGVTIHTVGFGTEAGGPVPDVDPATGRRVGFKRDVDGSVAVSRLDAELLREVAGETGGSYFDGSDPAALARLTREVASAPAASGRGAGGASGPALRYGWFLGLALLLVALDAVLAARERAAPPRPRARGGRSRLRAPAAVALILLAAGCNQGNRLYREGEYRRAAEAYARALAKGDRSPALRYNLGTALLQLEAYDSARAHLEAAAAAGDAAVRQPASYNGGNADLLPVFGRRVPDGERRPRLERAVAAYQEALRLDPADADAKWNLEIALGLLERDEPSGGGGGEDEGGGAGADPAPSPAPAPAGGTGLSTLEAERILAGAQRAEAEVQGEKLRRQPPRGRPLRDW
jgi:Ca-activated chloride channel family protein